MDEEKVQILFDTFKDEFGLESIDDFKNYLSDPTKRKMFYDEVIQPRYPGNSFEAFEELYGLKKKDNFNQDTDSPSESGTLGFFDSSQNNFATEVPKGEGWKKFKSSLKSTISGLQRVGVGLSELDVSIRQSLNPEFRKKWNALSPKDRERILSSTPGMGSRDIPEPIRLMDSEGNIVREEYPASGRIEWSDKLQEEADIINESLAQFETSIGQDLVSVENTGRGVKRLLNEVAGAIPSIALAMTPGGLYMLGASAAANKSRQLQVEGEEMTVSRYLNAVGTGVAEGYFEKFTRVLGNSSFKVLKQLYKEGGKDKVKESFKSIFYNFLKGWNVEGTSEVLTDVSERALDLVLTGDEKAFENFFLETADTYLIGGAAGGPLRTAGPGVRLVVQSAQARNLANKINESPYDDIVKAFKPETGDFSVDLSTLPIVEAPNSELFLQEVLKREVEKGKITNLEMQEIMDNYYTAQNVSSQLDGLELSDADKTKAASLLQELITLENFIKDKNPALVKKQKDRISEINKELENISEGKIGVVTEQTATREEAEKALFEEGVESPTEQQVLSKLDEIIQKSAPVTTTIPLPDTQTETEVVLDEDIDIVPPNELPLQKVLRKDDVIRKKIQDEKTLPGERKKAVLDLIGKLQPKGEVFALRARTLIKEASKLNYNNVKKVDEFIKKIDKTFDDAALKRQLKDARDEKKSIANKVSQLKKKDKLFGNLNTPAQQFLKINPDNVDNLKEYIEIAKKLNAGLIPTKTIKGKAKAGSPFIVSEINEYSTKELNKIKEQQQQLEEETYKALMGDLETTIPLKELKTLLYPEAELTPESKQEEANKKEKQIRSSLAKGFDSIGGVIQNILDTGVDPFSNEVINIDKQQKDLVERFLKIDTSKLTNEEAAFALDALNNFATNGSTAAMARIVKNYEGNLNRDKNIKDGLKVTESRLDIKQGIENKWLNNVASTTQTIDFAFKDKEQSSTFQEESGFSNVQADMARAETEATKITNEYKEQFPDSKKANNEAFNTEDNITERGMFAFVRRSVTGTLKEKQDEFNRRKRLVENDIKAFEKSTESDEVQLGNVYRRVYDKILKDSNNPLEVQSKVDPVNIEAVEWMTQKWQEIKPLLDKVALEVYNRELGTDENYTSDILTKKIVKDIPDLDAPISEEIGERRKIYDKETGVFKPVIKPTVLVDRFVNLNFDSGQLNNIRRALADAYSAENIAQLKGYIESADINKILGDGNLKNIIINKIKKYVDSKRGARYKDRGEKSVAKLADLGATIGTARVLGGPTQLVKQSTPLVNTLINAGGEITAASMEKFLTSKAYRDLVKNSGTAIANRGLGSSVVIDDVQENIKKKANTPLEKITKGVNSIFSGIKKANRWMLEKFLLPGDRFAANVSWLAYYAKEMRKQGVDILEDGFDIENHTINKKAANEAMRNVDRYQYVSDPNLQAEWYDPSNEDTRIFVKAFMPFSSFIMNEKTRNYIDATILTSKNSSFQQKQNALTSLTGTALEKLIFSSLGLGISTATAYTALNLLGFYDDEEEKKKLSNRIKGRAGNIMTDFLSPAPPLDPAIIVGLNYLLEYYNNPNDGQDPFQFFEGRPEDFFEQFGTYSIPYKQAKVLVDLAKINTEGKIGDYELNEAEKTAVKLLLNTSYLNALGVVPSETAQGINYVYDRLQQIASDARGAGETSSSMSKRQMESLLGEDIYEETDMMKKEILDIIREVKDELNIFD